MELFSLGHSNHAIERFLSLLRTAGVTAVADVRSKPYSRYAPQYSSGSLKARLKDEGLAYVFLGKELGGRPEKPEFYRDGMADYEAMAREDSFHQGLERLITGMQTHRIAMMCAEQHPLDCHRCRLVGRVLLRRGIDTRHILPDGTQLTQGEIEARLLHAAGQNDLFADQEMLLSQAYVRASKDV